MRIFLNISALLLLLPSCHLFVDTPPKVIAGQRAAYQSIIIGQSNATKLIDIYVTDCKKLVTYHENFIQQSEKDRDKHIDKAFDLIDERADKMRQQVNEHYNVSLQLVEAVYNYLSTSPINIDNIEFWIKRLDQISQEK